MRKLPSVILTLVLLFTLTVSGQNSGTPAVLRVKVDANGALLTSTTAQVPPYTETTFDNARLKTDSSGNLVVAGNGGSGGLTSIYDVTQYSIACNSTNASAAMATLLTTVVAAGGGTIYFPACSPGEEYRFDSQILIPNDGASPQPFQENIRFTGAGGGKAFGGTNNFGAAVLDLRYTSVDGNAKIESRGLGVLQIDNLTFVDLGTSNATRFIHSTNTVLTVHDNSFRGTGNVGQDFIVLGGTATSVGSAVNSPFQGYGTIIESNNFSFGNRGLLGLNWVNAVIFRANSFVSNTGTVAIELDCSADAGQSNHGNVINDNLIEMDTYTYGIKLSKADSNTFIGNQFFDPDGSVTSYIRLETAAFRNLFICGLCPTTRPMFSGDATALQTTSKFNPISGTTDIQGNSDIGSEIAYGFLIKGVYDAADTYPGPLTVTSTFNTNTHISMGLDISNSRGVLETRNGASAWPLYINPLAKGRVVVPDLTVSGATSTNISIVKGSSQSGQIIDINWGASANDLIQVGPAGIIAGRTNAGSKWQLSLADSAEYLRMNSNFKLNWSATTDIGTLDTGMARNAAGVVEVNNATAGTYRDLKLRAMQYTTGTRPTCDAAARGTTWYVAGGAGVLDTFEFCRKDAADNYAWVSLF